MPGVSRTCAGMISSLEDPIRINLLEELRQRPARLRLKRARPAAKLPPPLHMEEEAASPGRHAP